MADDDVLFEDVYELCEVIGNYNNFSVDHDKRKHINAVYFGQPQQLNVVIARYAQSRSVETSLQACKLADVVTVPSHSLIGCQAPVRAHQSSENKAKCKGIGTCLLLTEVLVQP
ncbi:peripheral plasma membrane CASK-like protein [Labeo rohita]|uniref:Peripheral plasma membrane CASK-like protein n=1 Tax=Labeo rohita TaxID=84645 RepID=A0A498NAQ0_LABRO|nr:peripheral plasma membrane CASK-like protein [Labeo rohita]